MFMTTSFWAAAALSAIISMTITLAAITARYR